MPDAVARIKAVGFWAFAVTLIICATVCVLVAADERTLAARVQLAVTELTRERERNTAAHAASLSDRQATKVVAAGNARAVADLKAEVEALKAEVARLKGARP